MPAVDSSSGPTRRFVLDADTALQGGAMTGVRLCGVRLRVLDATGREIARLRSASADYEPSTEVVVARGDVVVELEGQRRLLTAELHYAPRSDSAWSPTPTTFQRPGVEVIADSFAADSRFERVQAFRARGTFAWNAPP